MVFQCDTDILLSWGSVNGYLIQLAKRLDKVIGCFLMLKLNEKVIDHESERCAI